MSRSTGISAVLRLPGFEAVPESDQDAFALLFLGHELLCGGLVVAISYSGKERHRGDPSTITNEGVVSRRDRPRTIHIIPSHCKMLRRLRTGDQPHMYGWLF